MTNLALGAEYKGEKIGALGAEYKGEKIGALADLTAFSFHPVRHITTGKAEKPQCPANNILLPALCAMTLNVLVL